MGKRATFLNEINPMRASAEQGSAQCHDLSYIYGDFFFLWVLHQYPLFVICRNSFSSPTTLMNADSNVAPPLKVTNWFLMFLSKLVSYRLRWQMFLIVIDQIDCYCYWWQWFLFDIGHQLQHLFTIPQWSWQLGKCVPILATSQLLSLLSASK